MDDLLWSVAPKRSVEERQRLVGLLPQLVRRLRNGMKLVALSGESAQCFLGELAQRHAAAVRGTAASREQPAWPPESAGMPEPTTSDTETSTPAPSASVKPDEDAEQPTPEPMATGIGESVQATGDMQANRSTQAAAEQITEVGEQEGPAIDIGEDPFGETLARSHATYYEQPSVAPELPREENGSASDEDRARALQTPTGIAGNGAPSWTTTESSTDTRLQGVANPRIGTEGVTGAAAHAAFDDDITLEDIHHPAETETGEPQDTAEGMTIADATVEEDITLEDIRYPNEAMDASQAEDLEATIPEPGAAPFIKAGWLQFGADDADMEIEEITLGEASVESADTQDVPDDEHLQRARDLANGTWVEFSDDSGSTTRARLSWVSSATGVYLFTDRKGLKIAERTLFGLAAEFRRGSARIIESVPLIDRAVSNLINGFSKAATA